MEKHDYIDLDVKDSILFEDTTDCIASIAEMTKHDIRVDYSVNPPVLYIGKSAANIGDVVGVLADGSVFVVPAHDYCD